MTNWKSKYPIGSRWVWPDKVQGFVVAHEPEFIVCHNAEKTWHADKMDIADFEDASPYTEPRRGEFWVNVYKRLQPAETDKPEFYAYPTREECDERNDRVETSIFCKRLACVKVEWVEGEGL